MTGFEKKRELSLLRPAWVTALSVAIALPAVAAMGDMRQSSIRREVKPRSGIIDVILQGEDISRDTRGNAVGFVALVEGDDIHGGGIVRCVGAAVRTDVVVTAGHCLRNMRNLRVKFISSLSPLEYETVYAKDFREHPLSNAGDPGVMYDNFSEENSYKYHDIGVILLERSSYVAVPVTLTPVDLFPEELQDSHFFVFGRGRNFRTRAYNGKVEFARVLEPKPMRSGDNYFTAFLDTVGDVPQAVCQADSGGPVTISAQDEYIPGRNVHYLMGIFVFQVKRMKLADVAAASKEFGSEDAVPHCGMGMAFVNIHSELVWIEDTLAEMDPENPRTLSVFGRY
ncbi:trypsin-like serine protease [Rhizobium rhizophilum]|nr:trypsin-like serine protease [Rhizobium rhizophilum]